MMFALVACSYDDLGSIPQQPTADGPVQVRFSVQVPDMLQATRTMSSQEITSLKLVVFDENGYFVDDADATLIDYNYTDDGEKVAVEVESDDDTPDDDNEIQEQTYTVSLPQSASPRTIHFIANLPADRCAGFSRYAAVLPAAVGDGHQIRHFLGRHCGAGTIRAANLHHLRLPRFLPGSEQHDPHLSQSGI